MRTPSRPPSAAALCARSRTLTPDSGETRAEGEHTRTETNEKSRRAAALGSAETGDTAEGPPDHPPNP